MFEASPVDRIPARRIAGSLAPFRKGNRLAKAARPRDPDRRGSPVDPT